MSVHNLKAFESEGGLGGGIYKVARNSEAEHPQ